MYAKIKKLVRTKPLYAGILLVVIISGILYFTFSQSGTTADYNRTIDTVERIKEQQRNSTELNKNITIRIDRITERTMEIDAGIVQVEDTQQRAIEGITSSQNGLNEAVGLLERNKQLFRTIEEKY